MSNNPLMKNITDYLVDEGSFEEDILLGKNLCVDRSLSVGLLRGKAITSGMFCVLTTCPEWVHEGETDEGYRRLLLQSGCTASPSLLFLPFLPSFPPLLYFHSLTQPWIGGLGSA